VEANTEVYVEVESAGAERLTIHTEASGKARMRTIVEDEGNEEDGGEEDGGEEDTTPSKGWTRYIDDA
jgi:hypothetical protein